MQIIEPACQGNCCENFPHSHPRRDQVLDTDTKYDTPRRRSARYGQGYLVMYDIKATKQSPIRQPMMMESRRLRDWIMPMRELMPGKVPSHRDERERISKL